MKSKIFVSTLITLTLSACFAQRPFQPAPPEYKQWIKAGVSEQNIKQEMQQCGYPYAAGFGRHYVPNEFALAQQCMFSKGFKYSDADKGLCVLNNRKNMPACQGRQCSNKDEPGCSLN